MARAWCCILGASVTRGHPEPDASASRVVAYPRDGHERVQYESTLQSRFTAPPPPPCSPRAARTIPLITEFKKLARGSRSLLSVRARAQCHVNPGSSHLRAGASHDASAPPLAGGSSYTDWQPSC